MPVYSSRLGKCSIRFGRVSTHFCDVENIFRELIKSEVETVIRPAQLEGTTVEPPLKYYAAVWIEQ